jgi:hypothetical protein
LYAKQSKNVKGLSQLFWEKMCEKSPKQFNFSSKLKQYDYLAAVGNIILILK